MQPVTNKDITSYDLGDWISTFTGKKFYPCNPQIEDIDIVDIANALSKICRFTGHLRTFYSVADHSIRVMKLVREIAGPGDHRQLLLTALLHDASEAYLCDVARPVKRSEFMDGYRLIENKLESAIAKRFDLIYPYPKVIKEADDVLLATEARDLHPGYGPEWRHYKMYSLPDMIVPLSPLESMRDFMLEFLKIT